MAQETKQTQAPVLCATGCGFYGNPRTNGMCSVCYKDSAPRQNSTARVGLSESDGCSVAVESSSVAVSSALSLVASSMEQSRQSTEEVDFQTVGTGVQTEPQEVFCSTTESRVASEPEQCTLGQPEVADSSVAGQEGGSPVSELGCRRGKRKLEETDPQGEEATGGNEDCKSEMAQRWMTLTSLVTTRLASTNRRPLGASPAARKWASQVLTAGVETCFAAPTGTRTSTSAALTTGPRPQRRSGRRTLWSSERKSTKSKTVELCAFQSSS